MITAKSLWHSSPQHSEIRISNIFLAKEEVLVKSLYSLVSQGTERTVSQSNVPESMYEKMKVPYMEGAFSLPIKYGYSLVGEIVEGSQEWIGATVHCMHPHQSLCPVRPESLFVIPDNVPPLRACLISNTETALNAMWDGGLSAGDRVLIVGFGGLGALVGLLAQQFPATQIYVLEPNVNRQTLAQRLGFTLINTEDVKGLKTDVSFHCSGQSVGLQNAIEGVGKEGKVVELSWYGTRKVEVRLGEDFHYGRKKLISSQVSYLPADRLSRWNYNRRKKVVVDILKNEVFDLLLDTIISIDEAPNVFNQLRAGQWEALNCVISY